MRAGIAAEPGEHLRRIMYAARVALQTDVSQTQSKLHGIEEKLGVIQTSSRV